MRDYLRHILLVHKCVGCRKILDREDFDKAFCKDCNDAFLVAKMQICPECSQEVQFCRCMPKLMQREGVIAFRKLFFYDKEKRSGAQNRLIYFLKSNKSRRVSREAAEQLCKILCEEMTELEIDTQEAVIVCVPRSRASAARYGFDQSVMICRELSGLCNIEFVRALKRRRGGKPQKSLTAGERRKNIQNLLYPNKACVESVRDKTVILVDDVVTTGASMSACIHILKEQGARRVICIALSSDINT